MSSILHLLPLICPIYIYLCGSGSTKILNTDQIWIRIHNTVLFCDYVHALEALTHYTVMFIQLMCQCHIHFQTLFFAPNTPPGPLMNRLNRFSELFEFLRRYSLAKFYICVSALSTTLRIYRVSTVSRNRFILFLWGPRVHRGFFLPERGRMEIPTKL